MQNEKKTPDWLAIEGEYRVGVESVNAIAAKHGVTEGAIRARAKKNGWSRDPASAKRQIVRAAMAGITNDVTNDAIRKINAAADLAVEDMQRGLRINRMCLLNLESAAASATEPKEIKVIVEATGAAILAIRKICELDEIPGARKEDEEMSEAELDAELKKLGLSDLALEE
ncbi:MAG: hypothetical protein FWD79_11715 [Desulfobulbus sp.]|nr:hypothetical protein [Desulfobulbus sp.]